MEILSIRARAPDAELESVEPLLVLLVRLHFVRGKRFPLDLTVQVRTQAKKVLGVARLLSFGRGNLILDASGAGSETGNPHDISVVVPLTMRHIDHLEECREKHPKGDVVLECMAEVQFLASKATLATLHPAEETKPGPAGYPVFYRQESTFGTHLPNMWVLSGENGRTFLEREALQSREIVTISASDWLHDYISVWNNVRHVVIELPQPAPLGASSTPDLQDRVNAAMEAAKHATANMNEGRWSEVIEDLRPVWELLRNHAEMPALLQRDGYTAEAVAAFTTSIAQQFEFASKFIHRLDRAGRRINAEITAHKEDAMLCYSFALNVLNLIVRKGTRLS